MRLVPGQRRSGASDRGAAAVEAALVLPLLLLLVFGIIDFGRMLNAQIKVSEAARVGARALSVHADAGDRVDAVMAGTPYSLPTEQDCSTTPLPGDDATVTVNSDFEFITPVGALAGMFGSGFGGPVTLSATGVMPCRA
jgi:Flp pilus assembly protein TadG